MQVSPSWTASVSSFNYHPFYYHWKILIFLRTWQCWQNGLVICPSCVMNPVNLWCLSEFVKGLPWWSVWAFLSWGEMDQYELAISPLGPTKLFRKSNVKMEHWCHLTNTMLACVFLALSLSHLPLLIQEQKALKIIIFYLGCCQWQSHILSQGLASPSDKECGELKTLTSPSPLIGDQVVYLLKLCYRRSQWGFCDKGSVWRECKQNKI